MMRNLVNGAVGGALATAVYSAVLMAADKAGLLEEKPPRRFVRTTLPGPKHKTKPGEGVLATFAHYAFGATCGSVLGLLSAGQRVPVPLGAAYGLAVWYLGYEGLAPSLGAFPPASQDRPSRQAVLAAGHLVYGTALAIALNRLRSEAGVPSKGYEFRRTEVPTRQPVPAS